MVFYRDTLVPCILNHYTTWQLVPVKLIIIMTHTKIIDGKKIAADIASELQSAVAKRLSLQLPAPALAVIMVGTHPASQIYIKHKRKACNDIGFKSINYDLPADTTEDVLLTLIKTLNESHEVDGILVQLPLPAHIDMNHVIDAIDPTKDVDGFHPFNLGLLTQKRPILRPCTPMGITSLLKRTVGDITSKHAVIVGASNIVGRPLTMELIWQNCTVTLCHKYTHNLPHITRQADILVAAVGKPRLIQADWVSDGTVVIDVGINRLDNGRLVGDVDFDHVKPKASWITPVPGGVGPMTVISLMQNTLIAAEIHDKTR